MSQDKTQQAGGFVTPEFRVAFPAVFDARANQNDPTGTAKYEITMLFPKDADLSDFKKDMARVIREQFPDASKMPAKGTIRSPIRDGDEKAEWEGYAGHWFIKATSVYKPGIVDPACHEIIDPSKIYGGCWCRAYVRAFYYDNKGNKGVSFGLQHIQKLRDDTAFGNFVKATDVFSPVAGAETNDPDIYDQGGATKAGGVEDVFG